MKKIKRFYKEHRVFTILMAVAIVCTIIIATVLIQCFYVGNDTSKYGNRLDGIETVALEEDQLNNIEGKIIENELVKSAKLMVTGKIVYITINFEPTVDLVQAESVAQKSLELFEEDKLSFYDFQFTLKNAGTESSAGFLISGAKNKNGHGLIWNNNNPVTSKEEAKES